MSSFSEIKKKPEEIFPTLQPIFKGEKEATIGEKLNGSVMLSYMLKAKGGDQIKGI
jgi:hypothetical protein